MYKFLIRFLLFAVLALVIFCVSRGLFPRDHTSEVSKAMHHVVVYSSLLSLSLSLALSRTNNLCYYSALYKIEKVAIKKKRPFFFFTARGARSGNKFRIEAAAGFLFDSYFVTLSL